MTTRKAASVPVTREPEPVQEAPAPSIGRIVHYRLSEADATDINRRRERSQQAPPSQWGFQAHRGNRAEAGQVFPADVVRVFGTSGGSPANLQVKLDGTDILWVTSVVHGDEDGQWTWPTRN